MIRLAFIGPSRKIVEFKIEDKRVTYFDSIWKQGIQILPRDMDLFNKLKESNKPNLKMMAALLLDTWDGADYIEYKACSTDEEIAEFVRRDCRRKGLKEVI